MATDRRTAIGVVLWGCVFCLAAAPGWAADPPTVGRLGDPSRFEVQGAEQIPAPRVLAALGSDWEFQVLAHPFAPRGQFAESVKTRLLDGYRNSGFPQAAVEVRLDEKDERTLVTVREGPRYVLGPIVVTGNKKVPAAAIESWLTERKPDEQATPLVVDGDGDGTKTIWVRQDGFLSEWPPPLWKYGNSAPRLEAVQKSVRRMVERAYAEFGLHEVRFAIEPRLRHADKQLELAITIEDEGSPTVVREIAVEGLQEQSRERLLAMLDVAPGKAWTVADSLQTLHRLWSCGRFREQQLEAPVVAPGQVDLKIRVKELASAPPLGAPLSREDAAMLKLSRWCCQAKRTGDELAIQMSEVEGWTATCVVAVGRGALMRLMHRPAPDRPARFDHVVHLQENYSTWFAHGPAPVLRQPHAPNTTWSIRLRFLAGDDDKQNLKITATMSGGGDTQKELTLLQLNLDPAFCLAELRRPRTKVEWHGDELRIRNEKGIVRIDGRTGALLEMSVGEEGFIKIFREPGLYERWLQEAERSVQDGRDAHDPRRIFSSAAAFHARTLAQLFADQPLNEWLKGSTLAPFANSRFWGAAERLINAGALAELDRWAAEPDRPDEISLSLPDNEQFLASYHKEITGYVGGLGLPAIDFLFTRDSWPWIVGREAMFFAGGHSTHLQSQYEALVRSDRLGPLGCLVMAKLSEKIENRRAATYFATLGLQRQSVADFRKEFSAIVAPDSGAEQAMVELAKVLRHLDAADVAILGDTLFGASPQAMLDVVTALRNVPQDRVREFLPEIAEFVWNGGLRPRVVDTLQELLK